MLAFGIRYLNGFVAAASPDDPAQAEWPPDPGRVFMAMAAAHFQTDGESAERQALQWLEGTDRGGEISAPQIKASNATPRAVIESYVPVNDKPIWKIDPAKPKQKPPPPLQSAPGITRVKNPRQFARAWLDDDTAYLLWPDLDPPEAHRTALEGLCSKVTRIGHSSSLVQMWLADPESIEAPNWIPDDNRGIVRLRIPGPGTLDYLERQYNAEAADDYASLKVTDMETDDAKAKKQARKRLGEQYGNSPPPRQHPQLSLYQGYAPPTGTEAPVTPGTVFDPYPIVLRLTPQQSAYRALDLMATQTLVHRWREAILSHSNSLSEPVRRLLSGHSPDGGPSDDPHLAFLPLAFVGHEHADGHLLGMGLALPAELGRDDRREALRAIAAARQLKLGRLGVWRAEPVTESRPPSNLRPEAWTAAPASATHWSTVTPIVYDRHPKAEDKAAYQRESAEMIATACSRIGLPRPREVIVTHVSVHYGTPPAFTFPRLKREDGGERRHSHVILVFDEPVCGPMLIGAGRFRGHGVCRPIRGA